jgi:hypothetical protein
MRVLATPFFAKAAKANSGARAIALSLAAKALSATSNTEISTFSAWAGAIVETIPKQSHAKVHAMETIK